MDGDGVIGGSFGELMFMLLVLMEEVDKLIPSSQDVSFISYREKY